MQAAAFAVLALLAAGAARAAPTGPGHPLVGTWGFNYPRTGCFELYRIRSDGTTLVTSAGQVSESEIEVSAEPDAKGFYKWVDTVRKDNGQPDCSGIVSEVGQTVINYIHFNADKSVFVVCSNKNPAACVGPFVRMGGAPL